MEDQGKNARMTMTVVQDFHAFKPREKGKCAQKKEQRL
jgi:hypothetical protein